MRASYDRHESKRVEGYPQPLTRYTARELDARREERAREAVGNVLDVASKLVALACVGLILGVAFGVTP